MTKESNRRMLVALRDNKALAYIEATKADWINNQLPVISREQVNLEDLSLVSYIRRQTFREFIAEYSYSIETMQRVMGEVDKFTACVDANLFDGYVTIHQEQLRAAHSEMQVKEKQLLEAQAISQLGSFEWDFSGKGSSYTPEVFKIFEFDQTSTLEAFLDDVHPDDRIKVQHAIQRALVDGEYECEYRYQRNNKKKVIWSKGRVTFENGKAVRMAGTIMDVTEKHSVIARLQESEALSNQAQALTHTGTWTWHVETNEVTWSDEMYRIYGLEPQSEKITFERFINFVHPVDRDRRLADINKALETRVVDDYIIRIVTNKGLEKVLRGKGQVSVKDNRVVGIIGTCQDITHEYAMARQLEEKNEALVRKNRELEAFNFIASHDLQEPLRKIQVYASRIMTEGKSTLTPSVGSYFEKISHASNRMQKMIEDFLVFSQTMNSESATEDIELTGLVGELKIDLAHKLAKANADMDIQDLPLVKGVRSNIRQMFKELISNAIKFRKKLTPLEIAISSAPVVREGRHYACVMVRDNGIGFESRYANRIFDLFQRLHSKDEYSGSGIGLALCKKIAEDHQGWIEVQSEKDIGSAFMVYLPSAETKAIS